MVVTLEKLKDYLEQKEQEASNQLDTFKGDKNIILVKWYAYIDLLNKIEEDED